MILSYYRINSWIISSEEAIPFPENALCDYKINEECEVTVGEGDSLLAQLFDKVGDLYKRRQNMRLFNMFIDKKWLKCTWVVMIMVSMRSSHQYKL